MVPASNTLPLQTGPYPLVKMHLHATGYSLERDVMGVRAIS